MVDIATRQNEDRSIRLLGAQRVLYSDAKDYRNWRFGMATAVAGLGVITSAFVPVLVLPAKIAGGIVAVVAGGLLWIEKARIKEAAIIQEEFDTYVLQLPWDEYLVGDRPDEEDINDTWHRYRGPVKGDLTDWYRIEATQLPRPLDVLASQRTNLWWDFRLRESFGLLLVGIVVGVVLLAFAGGAAQGQTLLDFALGYLPYVSLIGAGLELAVTQFLHARQQKTLKRRVEAALARALHDPAGFPEDECRRIQGGIYSLRKASSPVPDWWHKRFRERFEDDSRAAIERYIAQLASARQ